MYVDQDGGGTDTTPFDTWAKATDKTEKALEDPACDIGSTIYVQGAAADSQTIAVTLTSEGIAGQPVRVIGCKNGTTAEPPVAADFSTRAGADMPKIELITTAGIDLTLAGVITFQGMEFDVVDRIAANFNTGEVHMVDCKITCTTISGGDAAYYKYDSCEMIVAAGPVQGRGGTVYLTDCLVKSSSTNSTIQDSGTAFCEIIACDLSDAGNDINVHRAISVARGVHFKNCKFKSTYTLAGGPMGGRGYVEAIACSGNTGARGSTSSFQDYEKESRYGTIDAESVILRTGGADDGADGAFSYAMVNNASAAFQGTPIGRIETPWMSVWVPGGASKTLTIYFTNDGAGDLNDDVICCDFFTPDANDTTQHLLTYDPSIVDRADGANAVTDDAASTWVTHNTNKQKFSVTTTPGFEGWAYAKVYLAQNEASPDVVYIDPKIEVV